MRFHTTIYSGLLALPLTAAAPQTTPAARICLAPAEAQMAYRNTDEAVAAVREAFASFLTGPDLTNTPLIARLASQVRDEARQAGCPYVLFTTMKQEHKTGNDVLGRVAGAAVEVGAWQVASTATSVPTRIVAGAAASGVATSVWARSIKAKDELTLSYRLESGDGVVLAQQTDKRKAKSDGEDLLTPLAQRASEAIAAIVMKPAR